MKLANTHNKFTVKDSIKSNVFQLRICKQQTTNITTFQAHFGGKLNTSHSNLSKVLKYSNLTFEQILNHFLDADTVSIEDYRDDNGLVTREISDILFEEAMARAQGDAVRRYNDEKRKSYSRFYLQPKLSDMIS